MQRQRADELKNTNAFLRSGLTSLRSGAGVANQKLNIVFWNHRAEDLRGLRTNEEKGQSLLNLDIGRPTQQLRGAIPLCLSGEEHQHVVLEATNLRGEAIKSHITCTSLVTGNRARQGVILTKAAE